MTHTRWFRIALGYMALSSFQIGAWALFFPQSFYDSFPGFGRAWLSVDGPYNEHFVRDFGALNLALVVVLVWAAVTLSRQLVFAAATASLVWGVPHVLYHLFNTEGLSGSDAAASVGGLVFFAALPIMVIATARTRLVDTPTTVA